MSGARSGRSGTGGAGGKKISVGREQPMQVCIGQLTGEAVMQTNEYDPLRLPDYEADLYVGSIVSGPSSGPATLHGTAFFINGEGNFLTAAHVLQAAVKKVEGTGDRICLTVRVPGTRQGNGLYLVSFNFAPAPFDIAVGRVASRSQSFVKLANATAGSAPA